jgi:AcrR family transcriptional regulator
MAVRNPTAAGIARREQILEQAARLFSRRGYHATSMRDIGEATGMLAGSLYAHIASKEELLYEIVMQAAEQFLGGLETVRSSDLGPEEKLRRAIRAHIEVVAGNVDEARVFHHEWKALTGNRLAEARRLRHRAGLLADLRVRLRLHQAEVAVSYAQRRQIEVVLHAEAAEQARGLERARQPHAGAGLAAARYQESPSLGLVI